VWFCLCDHPIKICVIALKRMVEVKGKIPFLMLYLRRIRKSNVSQQPLQTSAILHVTTNESQIILEQTRQKCRCKNISGKDILKSRKVTEKT